MVGWGHKNVQAPNMHVGRTHVQVYIAHGLNERGLCLGFGCIHRVRATQG